MNSPRMLDAVFAPLGLLARGVRHWLPLVLVLAAVSAIPEAVLQVFLRIVVSLISSAMADVNVLFTALCAVLLLVCFKLIIELATFMFAFVILADLTAGRKPDVWDGMRRLASWRLQFVWIVAGLFEQVAISAWFLGGAMILLPFGLVTTASYEEGTGFSAFGRSLELGFMQMGSGAAGRPGMRIALPVTLGFFVGAVVNGLLTVISFAPHLGTLLSSLDGGLPSGGFSLPAYGWGDFAVDLVFSPIGLLPTIYMMTVQQMAYWEARRFAEANPGALTRGEGSAP